MWEQGVWATGVWADGVWDCDAVAPEPVLPPAVPWFSVPPRYPRTRRKVEEIEALLITNAI